MRIKTHYFESRYFHLMILIFFIQITEILPSFATSDSDYSNLSPDFFLNYLNELVRNVTLESSIYDILVFSIGMVVYGIFIFHFYRFLSKKDIFSLNLESRLRGGKFKSSGEKASTSIRVAAYIGTNLLVFPIVIFVWFLIYSIFMFFLAQDMEIKTIFLVSSSMVIAIRIAAYYNEDLSKDLAKLIPFVFLGIFILSPTFFSLDQIIPRVKEIPNFIIQIAAFLVVAITVEMVLSMMYLVRLKFFRPRERKNKN